MKKLLDGQMMKLLKIYKIFLISLTLIITNILIYKNLENVLKSNLIIKRICIYRITENEIEARFLKANNKMPGHLDIEEFEKSVFEFIMSMRTIKEIEKIQTI